MSLIAVDTRSRKPIYEQLVENIRHNVICGDMQPGEQLTSVRALAGELAINPNTIQRAYNELEHIGVIISIPGRGSFISEDISPVVGSRRKEALDALTEKLTEAKNAGVEKTEAHDLVEKVWTPEQ